MPSTIRLQFADSVLLSNLSVGTSLDVKEVRPDLNTPPADERVLEVNRGLITRPEITFIMPPLLPRLLGWICTSP